MGMIAYYLPLDEALFEGLLTGKIDAAEYLGERSLAEDEFFDVDKAWQGIHFLVCGDPWEGSGPLFDLILGGTELAATDSGCGPARILSPERVKDCARAVESLDFESFRSHYDWKAFLEKEIYPRFDHDEFDYFAYYFSLLRDFFKTTAESGSGLLLLIS
jgi:hypothetical protein